MIVSVIVPIYNAAQFLRDCLDSIISQSYEDFECILVDDGSDDESLEICKEYSHRDPRFVIIHQDNLGVSSARNKGIQVARGEYIAFIDSDDWVDPDYLKELLFALTDRQSDLSVCGLAQEFSDGHQTLFSCNRSSFILSPDTVELFTDLNRSYLLFGPVVKLYRREIIRKWKICFDITSSYGEDLMFNISYLNHVTSITTIDTVLYHYRIVGPQSLSGKIRDDRFDIDYYQWKLLRSFYSQKKLSGIVSNEYLFQRLWGIVFDGIFLFPKLKNQSSDYIKRILQIDEIADLTLYSYVFSCARWIKFGIHFRMWWLFYLYFRIIEK
ncbi:MAG: glycosyltransferase [Bacteroidales bacterium]|nr:glycosyltransferase [Bacteroidales bacterium]